MGLTIVEEPFTGSVIQRLLADRDADFTARMGFAPTGGSRVAPEDFAPPDGAFFVARIAERPVGCGGLRRLDQSTGEVKRVFVSPGARRSGVARALMDAIEERAVRSGLQIIRLDTNSAAALALYRARGYHEIPDYNGNEYAHHWLEKRIAGS